MTCWTDKMLCVVATETEARRQPMTTSHTRDIRSAVSGSKTGMVSALQVVPTSCTSEGKVCLAAVASEREAGTQLIPSPEAASFHCRMKEERCGWLAQSSMSASPALQRCMYCAMEDNVF